MPRERPFVESGDVTTSMVPEIPFKGAFIVRINALDGQSAWAVTGADWVGGSGHLFHTWDGGQTWISQTVPVAPEFWGVSFVR
jgi:hypothetical protein